MIVKLRMTVMFVAPEKDAFCMFGAAIPAANSPSKHLPVQEPGH